MEGPGFVFLAIAQVLAAGNISGRVEFASDDGRVHSSDVALGITVSLRKSTPMRLAATTQEVAFIDQVRLSEGSITLACCAEIHGRVGPVLGGSGSPPHGSASFAAFAESGDLVILAAVAVNITQLTLTVTMTGSSPPISPWNDVEGEGAAMHLLPSRNDSRTSYVTLPNGATPYIHTPVHHEWAGAVGSGVYFVIAYPQGDEGRFTLRNPHFGALTGNLTGEAHLLVVSSDSPNLALDLSGKRGSNPDLLVFGGSTPRSLSSPLTLLLSGRLG